MSEQPVPVVTKVVVTDIRIPFTSWVSLMVTAAVAAIPAMIILMLFSGVMAMVFVGILDGK